MTLRSTLRTLEQDGGLISSRTSKTVDDAIQACCLLKEDYLWVDQYCIVQDDESDKSEQVSAMGTIYSSAAFVIIGTDGDTNDGIPGISYARPQTQFRLRLASIDFVNDIPDLQEIIGGQSVWSTRGWTYQEMTLPKRKLYLTGSQSFFECDKYVWHEDGSEEQGIWTPNTLSPPFWLPYIDYFYMHVGKYLCRNLGLGSDIYHAIEGVASVLYKERNPLWYGLLRKEFDKAMMWCPDDVGSADNGADETPILKNVPKSMISSWSWSSARHQFVLLDDSYQRQLQYCGTLVVWASYKLTGDSFRLQSIIPDSIIEFGCPHGCRNSKEPTTGIEKGRRAESIRDSREGACYMRGNAECLPVMALAWSQGCIEADYPFEPPQKTTFPCLMACVSSRWPCHYRYWQEAFQSPSDGKPGFTSLESLSRAINDRTTLAILQSNPKIIITRAPSALFRLNPLDVQSHNYPIIDDQNQMVGLLIGKDPQLHGGLLARVERGEKFEFIAVSMSKNDEVVRYDATDNTEGGSLWYGRASALVDDECIRDLTYYDTGGTPFIPLPVVNVMLIEWNGPLAHRVSIGWIYLTKWTMAQPRFKLVLLE